MQFMSGVVDMTTIDQKLKALGKGGIKGGDTSTLENVYLPWTRGAAKGISGLAGLPQDLATLAQIGAGFVAKSMGLKGDVGDWDIPFLPSSNEYFNQIAKIAPSLVKKSDTPVGRVVERGVELGTAGGGPQALIRGGMRLANMPASDALKRSTKVGAAYGGGSGVAGQTVRETTGDDMAGTITEVLGGFSSIPQAVRPSFSSRQAKQILSEAGTDAIEKARKLEQSSRSVGVPLTVPETLDTPAAKLVAGDVLASPSSAKTFGAQTIERNRPGEVRSAVQEKIGVKPGQSKSAVPALKLIELAKDQLAKARQFRTDQTNKFFQMGTKDFVPEDEVISIVAQIDEALITLPTRNPAVAALKQIKENLLTKTVRAEEGLTKVNDPQNSAGILYNIYKDTRKRMRMSPDNPDHISDVDGIVGPINERIRNVSVNNSENVKKGWQLYQEISEKMVDPLKRSAVGTLANQKTTQGVERMFSRFDAADASDIKKLNDQFANKQPAIYRAVIERWLQQQFEKASTLAKGEAGKEAALTAGAKFDLAIRGAKGSPQRSKFDEILNGLARSSGGKIAARHAIHSGWSRLLDVLSRTARLPSVGSPTAGRSERFAEAGSNITDVFAIDAMQQWRRWARDVVYKREYGKLAKALSAEGGIDALVALGKARPRSQQATALAVNFATLTDAALDED